MKPLERTCREPCVTGWSCWWIERSGTKRCSLSMFPRSCTMRPKVVPMTTQPILSAPKEQDPGSELLALLRHSLSIAKESTRSTGPALCSHSLEICHVRFCSARAPRCALATAALPPAVRWLPTKGSKGHSARALPWSRSTKTRQVGSRCPLAVQPTLASFNACPSRLKQGAMRLKRAASTGRAGSTPKARMEPDAVAPAAPGSCSVAFESRAT
mmetsp:Transcript_26211/g.82950  ORF Transcript_26211/g.82950 Transcript_26211/m.82950 type:complete len:214 (-) Transcript_26211:1896-2537(-)